MGILEAEAGISIGHQLRRTLVRFGILLSFDGSQRTQRFTRRSQSVVPVAGLRVFRDPTSSTIKKGSSMVPLSLGPQNLSTPAFRRLILPFAGRRSHLHFIGKAASKRPRYTLSSGQTFQKNLQESFPRQVVHNRWKLA